MDKQKLILWLNTKIDKKSIIFDKVLDINSVIRNYLVNNNLKLKISSDIFLIHLCKFLFDHSIA